jgi:hypothetical protein
MIKIISAVFLSIPLVANSAVISVGRSVIVTGGVSSPSSCEIRYAQCLGSQELSPERMQVLIKEVLDRKTREEKPKPENKIVEKLSNPYIVPEKKLTEKQKVLQEKLNQVNIQKERK